MVFPKVPQFRYLKCLVIVAVLFVLGSKLLVLGINSSNL